MGRWWPSVFFDMKVPGLGKMAIQRRRHFVNNCGTKVDQCSCFVLVKKNVVANMVCLVCNICNGAPCFFVLNRTSLNER